MAYKYRDLLRNEATTNGILGKLREFEDVVLEDVRPDRATPDEVFLSASMGSRAVAEATLAVAYEQRIANLTALYNTNDMPSDVRSSIREYLATYIAEALDW